MAKFRGTVTVEIEIDIDESVFKRCLEDEDWKSTFYTFADRNAVAANLAYNFARNVDCLSNLDGFADMDDSMVKVISADWDSECEEVKPKKVHNG